MVKLRDYEMIGIFIILGIALILGLFAMNFDLTNSVLRVFLPTNTSLWEIGKLLFVSTLIYAIFEYFAFGDHYENFGFAKLGSLVLGPLCYILITYLVDLSFGNVNLFVHVLMFFISIALAQYISYYLMEKQIYFKLMNVYAGISVVTILLTFVVYTNNRAFSHPIFSEMKTYQNQVEKRTYYEPDFLQ